MNTYHQDRILVCTYQPYVLNDGAFLPMPVLCTWYQKNLELMIPDRLKKTGIHPAHNQPLPMEKGYQQVYKRHLPSGYEVLVVCSQHLCRYVIKFALLQVSSLLSCRHYWLFQAIFR